MGECLPSSPSREERYGNDMDPVKEIFAKEALVYLTFQILIRRHNDPYIHFDQFFTADGVELPLLKNP